MNDLIKLVLFAFILPSCVSSVQKFPAPLQGMRGDVMLPASGTDDGYAEFIPQLASSLSQKGFTPVTGGSPKYSTEIYIGGGALMKSMITLKEGNVPRFTAESFNPGFGTFLARGTVRRSLFKSSLKKFSQQLDSLP